MKINLKEREIWKNELKNYESNKKKSFSTTHYKKSYNRSHKLIKKQEFEYNTILNKFKDKKKEELLKNKENFRKNIKLNSDHNIITLKGIKKKKIATKKLNFNNQKSFNIINNNILNPNDPNLKKKNKKIYKNIFRDFNIVSNKYWKNHENRFSNENNLKKNKCLKKLKKQNIFNPLNCEFYDSNLEKNYIKKREKINSEKPKIFFEKLPKSYKVRETIQLSDFGKEKISEETKLFDRNKKNPLFKYKKRYQIEKQFKKKCENDLKKEDEKLDRYYVDKFIDDYKTGFHPISLKKMKENDLHLEMAKGNKDHLHKKNLWDKLK